MNRYRLVVTGKLYHLIKLLSDRTDCLKDSKKEPLADTYELKEVELETMRIFGHKSGDNEEAKKGNNPVEVQDGPKKQHCKFDEYVNIGVARPRK